MQSESLRDSVRQYEDAETDQPLLAARLADEPVEIRHHLFEFGQEAIGDAPPPLPSVVDDEVVIACTFDANGNKGQAEVVRRAIDADYPVIVLALRNPYDLRAFPDASTFLTTYDPSPLMIVAAGDVLLGREEPRGTLPVSFL